MMAISHGSSVRPSPASIEVMPNTSTPTGGILAVKPQACRDANAPAKYARNNHDTWVRVSPNGACCSLNAR